MHTTNYNITIAIDEDDKFVFNASDYRPNYNTEIVKPTETVISETKNETKTVKETDLENLVLYNS